MNENVRISCPRCDWEPHKGARWQCSCKHLWNTFDTGGRCPVCRKVWKDTQCLNCWRWSPHLDWYKGLDGIVQKLKEEILEDWEIFVDK
jgi:hypothetical protein